ncbi:hypothetical protein PENSUB_3951 [Penicillium subrubescens]|uniref:Uncharacterized protein n=1 Tax=Penicillium subrubescens TaxID=1316194 RepID=A0A1Q5UDU0_9EURO|nr:hypothetical protein PENSUB_3951 [Penicillium subrubescens]
MIDRNHIKPGLFLRGPGNRGAQKPSDSGGAHLPAAPRDKNARPCGTAQSIEIEGPLGPGWIRCWTRRPVQLRGLQDSKAGQNWALRRSCRLFSQVGSVESEWIKTIRRAMV